MTSYITMATKLLQKTSAYIHLVKVLNCGTQASISLRNCQRCFSCSQPTSHSMCTVAKRHGDGIIAFLDRTTKQALLSLLRSHKGLSRAQLTERWFSDFKMEELNATEFTPAGEPASNSSCPPESHRVNILGRDAGKPSKFPQTEENETALPDTNGAMGERVETQLSCVECHDVMLETDGQGAESIEVSGNGVQANSGLARTESDQNQVQTDILAEQETPTVLEEFIQPLLPTESPSLAAYADHSPTLQKLVQLGVDLSKVDKKAQIRNALLKMDFDRHIKEKIVLLHQAGVRSGEGLGRFLTINPFILTEELEDLEMRLRYLRSKKFSDDAITQVLIRAPYFLSFSVERVDSKLGFYQKELSLTGDEIRHIITKTPKLVTFKIQRVKENIFVLRQQLGFTVYELKKLILGEPKVLLRGKEKLIGIFDYLHNHMGIPHKQLLNNPQVFNGRVFKIQERHQFLKLLGHAQYDPTQPGYVSIERLTKLPDDIFCKEIAKSSLDEYDNFLKTL